MKYARLPLRMREGGREKRKDPASPGASTRAGEPLGLQQGQREESLGETEGPFPSQASDVELLTTLEVISAES